MNYKNTVITLNKSIEQLFSVKNIDPDCDKIAKLMLPFQKQISSDLSSGDNIPAVELFLQLLSSIAKHFVEDEHWCYFDDYYFPDYLCMNVFDSFKKTINAGQFLPEEVKMLRDGLQEIADMEDFQNGCTVILSILEELLTPAILDKIN